MKEKVKKEEEVIDEQDGGQVYELGYHLLPSVSEIDLVREVAQIHSIISEYKGVVISEGAPTLRPLAYEIVKKVETKNLKFSKAFFGWVKFEMDRSHILDLQNKIEVAQNLLRFIVIKTVKENTMHTPKVPSFKKEVSKDETALVVGEKLPVSEEEIDKSIDELLVNEDPKL